MAKRKKDDELSEGGWRRRNAAPPARAGALNDRTAQRFGRRAVALLEATELSAAGHPKRAKKVLAEVPMRIGGGNFAGRGAALIRGSMSVREMDAGIAALHDRLGLARTRAAAIAHVQRNVDSIVARMKALGPDDTIVPAPLAEEFAIALFLERAAYDGAFWCKAGTPRRFAHGLLAAAVSHEQMDDVTDPRSRSNGWRSYDMTAAMKRDGWFGGFASIRMPRWVLVSPDSNSSALSHWSIVALANSGVFPRR